ADVLDAAALDYLLENEDVSGFDLADGFQANALGGRRFVFRDEADAETTRFVRRTANGFIVQDGEISREVQAEQIDAFTVRVASGEHAGNFMILRLDDAIQVSAGGQAWQLTRVHPFAAQGAAASDEAHPGAPMPGRIVAVHVKAGDHVEQGQPLVVMEGMKMEVTVKAGVAGTIEKVLYAEGDTVEADAPLVDILPS
ncbi:MAG TPA: biotin/lipoyl-containing protein, partial [Gammaproteobacteria bacterium]